MKKENIGFGTKVIHTGRISDTGFNAVTLPIYQTTNFRFESAEDGGAKFAGEKDGFTYTTYGNPTVRLLEQKLAEMEEAEDCCVTGSGMGAIGGTIFSLARAGKHIVADTVLFSDTFLLLSKAMPEYGVEVDFIDFNDEDALAAVIKENTCCVYFETPTNPTLKIIDIEKTAKIVHDKNPDTKVVIDNTFASFMQSPLSMGADVVVHSTTKYINGHGDVIGGCVCSDAAFIDRVKNFAMRFLCGSFQSPHDAFLVMRGLKTYELRMERHQSNAMALARFLEENPKVKKVYYPGLESHPGHDVAARQMKGFGGMISFEVESKEAGAKLIDTIRMCTVAISLGDPDTLVQHPASMTHNTYTKEDLENAGIPEGLVRISVGLENIEDIIADFEQALAKI